MNAPIVTDHPARPDDHIIVLFGATGDLAKRKILPGLFHLAIAGLLPKRYHIIGSAPARFSMSTDAFRQHTKDSIEQYSEHKPIGQVWEDFQKHLSFACADTDGSGDLVDEVARVETTMGGNVRRLHHLAVPPDAVTDMIKMLGATRLNIRASVICEKPFGTDLASANALDDIIKTNFDESQVFRIDHFLGKESIDNILALRFANGLFEPIWNRYHVRYVQIDVPETLSIEGRAAFFEETGTFRDMVVTHLFQVLGFIAMEQPSSLRADPLRNEIVKVFESIAPLDPANVVRGQYAGYREEPGVDPESDTETFIAMRVDIENSRWKGVPFYLRTGKCLAESRQVITIGLNEPPMRMFPSDVDDPHIRRNKIIIDFADPGTIETHILTKLPGPYMKLGESELTFRYQDSFCAANNLEAYEHLIFEAMVGNQALFTRSDGIVRLWEIAAPILDQPRPIEFYEKGSWGPSSISDVVAPHHWILPAAPHPK